MVSTIYCFVIFSQIRIITILKITIINICQVFVHEQKYLLYWQQYILNKLQYFQNQQYNFIFIFLELQKCKNWTLIEAFCASIQCSPAFKKPPIRNFRLDLQIQQLKRYSLIRNLGQNLSAIINGLANKKLSRLEKKLVNFLQHQQETAKTQGKSTATFKTFQLQISCSLWFIKQTSRKIFIVTSIPTMITIVHKLTTLKQVHSEQWAEGNLIFQFHS
eukprot:TRINITY_DN9257_c0_g1_i2.p1 TRINITY_DN9257_c0_g1~~TRINITY_DN9257_c0_g1_i2.p1  ORF type:complete len:218 (+),score=-20.48 TRINITY_DN9257_c0_g1_i2:453-1106(+)